MSNLRISFFGDDFTGSTDAMESLARSGLRTILFTKPPTREQLDRYPDLQAFGIAGTTRSMTPDEMERTLRPVFESLRDLAVPIVHYKVCSTFDSSPQVGSIGRVIDIGAEVFASRCVPVLAGAPALGRYCVFGNLYARLGAGGEVFRLDRHPSMSRHPVTPMDEADLRVHLSKQTKKKIGLLDVTQLDSLKPKAECEILLIDILHEDHHAPIGRLLIEKERRQSPLFVVGSSAVESAFAAAWETSAPRFDSVGSVGPIVAVCGSCSPVTMGQIQWATTHGFDDFTIPETSRAIESIAQGKSVVIHTNAAARVDASVSHDLGAKLGRALREILSATRVRRVVVAGGDTSGEVAAVLGFESMEMIAELTRGAPLCRVTAPDSPADKIEMTFKGGQIGPPDFFGIVQRGS